MAAKKKSVTLSDVAKYANVSIKTVSNVVNDWPYVSDEMRAKVKDAITATGYRPNQTARSLITGQSKLIGIITPTADNVFYNSVIKACSDVLYENGYSLVLSSSEGDSVREQYYLDALRSHGVDAFTILGTFERTDELQHIITDDIPLVTIGYSGQPVGQKHTLINYDNLGGACTATEHLLQQGYQRIAHLTDNHIDIPDRLTARNRLLGYQQALERANITSDPQLVRHETPSVQGGFRAMRTLLQQQSPDAVFCYNDLMAIGAILATQSLGKEVPRDIAVVGFDDILFASICFPPLTTMRIPQYELGSMVGRMLIESLKDDTHSAHPRSLLLPVELKVRMSCGAIEATQMYRNQLLETFMTSSIDRPDKTDAPHADILENLIEQR